jgi:oligopeptide transport system substrate-binding protein
MKSLKRILSAMLTAAILAAALSGCTGTGGSAATSSTSPEQEPFHLSVCLAPNPESIDPALNYTVDGAILIQHFFEGLMKWTDDGEGNAVLVSGQAASYEKADNADGTCTYTFHLRNDIYWNDGKPVTAGDFVYSWQRVVNPDAAAAYAYIAGMVANANEIMMGEAAPETLGVSAPDDSTFRVDLTYDCPYFPEICAFPALLPVREDIIEANGDQWTFDPATYLSNGPYQMTEWTQNSQIVAVPNEYYYDADKLGPDSITFRFSDDANAIYNGFRAGELSFIESVPVNEAATLLENGTMKAVANLGTYFISFNTQKYPFDDARVREAFTLIIDSQYIVQNVTQTGETPATGFVPYGIYDAGGAGSDDFRTVGGDYWQAPTTDEIYQANCDKARELLAEAGYPDGEGFPIVEYLYNTDDRNRTIAEALQSMWTQELGVTVKLTNQDWAVVMETCMNGDYDLSCGVWLADYNDPSSFLETWMTGGGNNIAQYTNPDFDAAVEQAGSNGEAAERMAELHKAEDILIGQDYALAPIFFYTYSYCADPALKGDYYNPMGYFFFDYASMEK